MQYEIRDLSSLFEERAHPHPREDEREKGFSKRIGTGRIVALFWGVHPLLALVFVLIDPRHPDVTGTLFDSSSIPLSSLLLILLATLTIG